MRALVGLGSNIDPERNVPLALRRLGSLATVERTSQVWQTPPVGMGGPPFHNCAALLRTRWSEPKLRAGLHAIEAELGRVRGSSRFEDRTIDLDLLAFRTGRRWIVVEPSLASQPFILHPLAEVEPLLLLPSGETVAQAVARRPLAGAKNLGPLVSHLGRVA
jgi:2-amino-4-hydroxy-6-hydroxymethyldihydropteridine diphosphokinase